MARILLVILLACAPVWAQASNAQVMREYGASLLAQAPASVRAGSTLVRARYAFSAYCKALDKFGAPLNATLTTRFLQLVRNGASDRWTCGDHALNLENLFAGMGIQKCAYLQADSDAYLPTPNSDHGALVVQDDDGRPYVFDAWGMAVENAVSGRDNYVENKQWNGMSLQGWNDTMTSAGYVRFTIDTRSFFATCQQAWDNTFDAYGKKKGKPKTLATPAPTPAATPTPARPPAPQVQGRYYSALGMTLGGTLYGVTVIVDYDARSIVAASGTIQPYFGVSGRQTVANGKLDGTARFDFTLQGQNFEFTGYFAGSYDAQGRLHGNAYGTLTSGGRATRIEAQPMQTVRWEKL